MYLILKDDNIVYQNNILDTKIISNFFDIKYKKTGTGEIIINGITDSISYSIEEYTEFEAIEDFIKNRLLTILKRWGFVVIKGEIL